MAAMFHFTPPPVPVIIVAIQERGVKQMYVTRQKKDKIYHLLELAERCSVPEEKWIEFAQDALKVLSTAQVPTDVIEEQATRVLLLRKLRPAR